MKKLLCMMLCVGYLFGYGCDLGDFVGYTILAKKTIKGQFNGCDYNRKIVFTDGTYVTCDSYGYAYGYMEDAIILSNGRRPAMCVGRDKFDIR